uniref:Uncharacterized protein n=1 Tax=Magallana gigas TaxID=29159 RepID=K1PQV3_MAGGI
MLLIRSREYVATGGALMPEAGVDGRYMSLAMVGEYDGKWAIYPMKQYEEFVGDPNILGTKFSIRLTQPKCKTQNVSTYLQFCWALKAPFERQ